VGTLTGGEESAECDRVLPAGASSCRVQRESIQL